MTAPAYFEIHDEAALSSLPELVRMFVPPSQVEMLVRGEDWLRESRESASHPPARSLLSALRGRRPRIEISVPDPTDPWSGGQSWVAYRAAEEDRFYPRLGGPARTASAGALALLPSEAALAELFRLVGTVDLGREGVAELFVPDDWVPVAAILATLTPIQAEAAARWAPVAAHGVYCAAGAWLCRSPDGSAFWLGLDTDPAGPAHVGTRVEHLEGVLAAAARGAIYTPDGPVAASEIE